MKKIFLTLIVLLFTDSYAANCTPIVCDYVAENEKNIFEKILKYSFATARHPENITGLTSKEIVEIAENENEIIEQKIKELDKNARVCFIPKTLYQLFAFRYIAAEQSKAINRKAFLTWKKK